MYEISQTPPLPLYEKISQQVFDFTKDIFTKGPSGKPYDMNCAVFFNIIQSGGGQTHVQKLCCKYSIILAGFLAT